MKKWIIYAPATIFTLGAIVLNIILKTFSPLWYAWALLLWIGGLVMN